MNGCGDYRARSDRALRKGQDRPLKKSASEELIVSATQAAVMWPIVGNKRMKLFPERGGKELVRQAMLPFEKVTKSGTLIEVEYDDQGIP